MIQGPTDLDPPSPAASEASIVREGQPGQAGQDPRDGSDRFTRLAAAGATMRGAIRQEVQSAVGQAFELVLERARADFQLEVGRLKTEVRRELEALEANVQSIKQSSNQDDPELLARLDRITASLEETRVGVHRLQKRYLPGSSEQVAAEVSRHEVPRRDSMDAPAGRTPPHDPQRASAQGHPAC